MTNNVIARDNIRMEMDAVDFLKLKSLLNKQGELKLNVVSDSMYPLLKIGTTVTVRPCQTMELEKFDIIVFWGQGKMVSHFLWAKQRALDSGEVEFITKSLKEPLAHDIPIKGNLILGKIDHKLNIFMKVRVWLRNL